MYCIGLQIGIISNTATIIIAIVYSNLLFTKVSKLINHHLILVLHILFLFIIHSLTLSYCRGAQQVDRKASTSRS